MFTGIVKGVFPVVEVIKDSGFSYAVSLPAELRDQLAIGASIAVDGVCQTVVKIIGNSVYFDVIDETLRVTTIDKLQAGRLVNIERSLKYGDEVGGHLLSGHVMGTAEILEKEMRKGEVILRLKSPETMRKYFFSKGFIAIDGISLTVVGIAPLSVHLIPETLRMTTLGFKNPGDRVNIEIDHQTKIIVDNKACP